MRTDGERPGVSRREWAGMAALMTLTLCVGVHLVVATQVIRRDGVTFIEFARGLQRDGVAVIHTEYQHPGYPVLIMAAHRLARVIDVGDSTMGWVYTAQSVTLLFRVLAVIPLYFIGRRMVGAKRAFVGCLLIAILPDLAAYGSDALSDWPNVFFVACGLALLMRSASGGSWWLSGVAGMMAGIAYLMRPEGAIVVVVGGLWAGWQSVVTRHLSRGRAVIAGLALLAGFVMFAGPYMAAKGAVFPKKSIGEFSAVLPEGTSMSVAHAGPVMAAMPLEIEVRAVVMLARRVGEMLVWFFVPMLVVGAIRWFGMPSKGTVERFFVGWLLAVSATLAVWLYVRYGYMSRRHILVMMTVAVFLVPVGIDLIAERLARMLRPSDLGAARNQIAAVILLTGAAICLVKLWGLADTGRQGYIEAAGWLRQNTLGSAVVAVADPRIAFYAERKWVPYDGVAAPAEAGYVVQVSKTKARGLKTDLGTGIEMFEYPGQRHGELSVTIYKQDK